MAAAEKRQHKWNNRLAEKRQEAADKERLEEERRKEAVAAAGRELDIPLSSSDAEGEGGFDATKAQISSGATAVMAKRAMEDGKLRPVPEGVAARKREGGREGGRNGTRTDKGSETDEIARFRFWWTDVRSIYLQTAASLRSAAAAAAAGIEQSTSTVGGVEELGREDNVNSSSSREAAQLSALEALTRFASATNNDDRSTHLIFRGDESESGGGGSGSSSDSGTCYNSTILTVRTLAKLLRNVTQTGGQVEKYRRINLNNNKIKTRVASVDEAISLLTACGFERTEGGNALEISVKSTSSSSSSSENEQDKPASPNFMPSRGDGGVVSGQQSTAMLLPALSALETLLTLLNEA